MMHLVGLMRLQLLVRLHVMIMMPPVRLVRLLLVPLPSLHWSLKERGPDVKRPSGEEALRH